MSKYLRARGKPLMERVLTPSLSIIYPLTQKISKKVFSVLFTLSLNWIKEKSVVALAYREICEQKMQTSINSRFCHRIKKLRPLLGINYKSGVYLRV